MHLQRLERCSSGARLLTTSELKSVLGRPSGGMGFQMKLCIHRGTREIGGTCVEVESSGQRILLDLGLPLNAKDVASTPLPAISGLAKADPSLLAIVLSH